MSTRSKAGIEPLKTSLEVEERLQREIGYYAGCVSDIENSGACAHSGRYPRYEGQLRRRWRQLADVQTRRAGQSRKPG